LSSAHKDAPVPEKKTPTNKLGPLLRQLAAVDPSLSS
jgi:hypothetical protein